MNPTRDPDVLAVSHEQGLDVTQAAAEVEGEIRSFALGEFAVVDFGVSPPAVGHLFALCDHQIRHVNRRPAECPKLAALSRCSTQGNVACEAPATGVRDDSTPQLESAVQVVLADSAADFSAHHQVTAVELEGCVLR